MKKFLSLLITATMLLLVACSPAKGDLVENAVPVDVTVLAMKGPTAMGLVDFMTQNEAGKITTNNYDFTILTAIDEVTAKIGKGEADIATVPANVASVLFNKTEGKVKVLGINTLGVLYIVENGDTITSINDLAGKTIYASGKGATPEYALNKILAANGLKDVTIEWKSEQAEVVAAIAKTEGAIAMLPEPFATTALSKNEALNVVLDLTKVWKESEIDGSLVTGVVIANSEFIASNPAAIEDFMTRYQASVDFVNSSVEEAAKQVGSYEIVPEPVAKVALPKCNITLIDETEMKDTLSSYLTVLFEQNPKSIGGKMPTDEFYYIAE